MILGLGFSPSQANQIWNLFFSQVNSKPFLSEFGLSLAWRTLFAQSLWIAQPSKLCKSCSSLTLMFLSHALALNIIEVLQFMLYGVNPLSPFFMHWVDWSFLSFLFVWYVSFFFCKIQILLFLFFFRVKLVLGKMYPF